ncbi:SMP-30/gluconolactonase/LRE family protein [Devosia nitrariae]|uniref:Senescence marker protein-30 n=1 Tax=Devosia nitrariae TaxID=2071872 RepID=A0ABQ5W4A7_9HYPH|nr:SMP-30/gluconolactonase/LRE family protein [Devosia nitrariae]GLQ54741.1 senescence marker protein-30 [Devosia nitrariae]
MRAFDKVAATHCRVGESLVWDGETEGLLWCDIHAGRIYRLDTRTHALEEWQLPERIGSFGLADDGRLIVAMVSGVHLYDPANGVLTFLVDPEPEQSGLRPTNRLNDGKVGPDGAFWVGSMHSDGFTAALYRVTADGRSERKVSGLGTSNGLAFSADGTTMFHSDSKQCWIDRYDFDVRTGDLSNRTRIASPGEAEGRPDGGATDIEGRYWSAGVSARRINCFAPDGALLTSMVVPPKRPTMPCFGGNDMRTLYFTSLRNPNDASEDCGDVFRTRVEVPGVPVPRFRTRAHSVG